MLHLVVIYQLGEINETPLNAGVKVVELLSKIEKACTTQ
jgi:hypothetical protein